MRKVSKVVHRGGFVLPNGPRTGRTLANSFALRAKLASGKGSKAVQTTPFQERVYAKLRTVPRGKVTTYGDLAKVLKTSSRAIGQAMRCNPYAPTVPCHRVVAANGTIGGFKGEREGNAIKEKIALLKTEGITITTTTMEINDFQSRRHRW